MRTTNRTNQPDAATLRAAARLMYESTPARLIDVAEEFKVTGRTIANWSAADASAGSPWQKLNSPQITERANAVADQISSAVANVAGEDERQAITAQLREDAAVSQRAQLLDRHRQELNGPRKLLYEAMTKRDAELVKLAKGAAETLRILQESERRAWGLDPAAVDKPSVVVIERS